MVRGGGEDSERCHDADPFQMSSCLLSSVERAGSIIRPRPKRSGGNLHSVRTDVGQGESDEFHGPGNTVQHSGSWLNLPVLVCIPTSSFGLSPQVGR
jgi:hypothetical protein